MSAPSYARGDYLFNEVMTASPAKLHLMLIEAAVRQVHRAAAARSENRAADAVEPLLKAQEILGEMMAGLNADHDPTLVRRMRGVYLFAFRALVAEQIKHDPEALVQVLKLLEFERETWRLACERVAAESAAPTFAPHIRPKTPATSVVHVDQQYSNERFSLEA